MTKGIKTTEFWLGFMTVILAYLNKELGLNVPVEVVVSTMGLAISYIAARTWMKKA